MKKTNLLIVLLIANLSLISCTAESLDEATETAEEVFATDGEEQKPDPGEEPPGEEN